MKIERKSRGITLVALVVTIVVLLILAGITILYVFGESSVFKQALDAKEQTAIAKAREKLEVALSDAKIYKHTEAEYNENEYLDELILNKVPDSKIKGDVAISDGYAFLLDRSIPWIGEYVGKEEDLILPEVTVAEVIQADSTDNYRTAKIEITATIDGKAKNGINRIEIWQNGVKLSTIPCDNEKTVTKEYKANRNGKYTIKAYADMAGSARTTVEGIVPAVEFTPNGSTEWKKLHTTTVKVKETTETVTEMKYLWKKSSEGEPQVDEFTKSCMNNSSITGQGDDMTGKYYLWVLVTLGTGTNQRTYTNGSEEFYFDNEGPNINSELFKVEKYSEKGVTFNITAKDEQSGIVKIEYYIDDVIQNEYTKTYTEPTSDVSLTQDVIGIDTGSHECKIIVYDLLENYSSAKMTGTTKLYAWEKWETKETYEWKIVSTTLAIENIAAGSSSKAYGVKFDSETGTISRVGSALATNAWDDYPLISLEKSDKIETGIYIAFSNGFVSNGVCHYNLYNYRIDKTLKSAEKGDNLIGVVTSTSSTTYVDKEQNTDGYWYISIAPQ